MLDPLRLEALAVTRPELAAVFETYQNHAVKAYAELLYPKDAPGVKIEPALQDAFREEMSCMELDPDLIERALQALLKTAVLQTSHHITPTNGPTFLTIDMITLLGLPSGMPYLVGANSGVPFSNSAWSGAISYGDLTVEQLVDRDSPLFHSSTKAATERKQHGETDQRISLIPAKYRDKLLFGTHQTAQLEKVTRQLSAPVQSLFTPTLVDHPYTLWAAKNCSRIQNQILDRSDIIYLDINRVIKRYLVKILSSKNVHPVEQLLFDPEILKTVNRLFDNPNMFLGNYKGKKSFKVEPLKWDGVHLISEKKGQQSLTKKEMMERLANDELCPGLLLLFFILQFVNQIRCLGSFNQVEYLETFRQNLQQLEMEGLHLNKDVAPSLTCGRLKVEGAFLHPMDMAIRQETVDLEAFAGLKMNHLWQPILEQLTS